MLQYGSLKTELQRDPNPVDFRAKVYVTGCGLEHEPETLKL